MGMWNKGIHIIRKNSKYVLLGTVLFIVSGLLGYLNAESIQSVAVELLKELEKIAKEIQDNGSPLYTFWVIFKNNVLASLSMLGLGVFFGIYPVMALLSNGVLLGFMLKTFALKGASPFSILLFGILPHGIIEIFAVIVAAAVGIKYGSLFFKILGNLANPNRRTSIVEEFKDSLQDLPFIVVSVVVLLFVAAVIESTLTPVLIQTFIGDLSAYNNNA